MKNLLASLNIFLIFFVSYGCKGDNFNAELAAKSYCECMQNERKSGKDIFESKIKCDGELLSDNRFFRLDYLDKDVRYKNYFLFLPQTTRDSVAIFHGIFYNYIMKNCCKEAVIGCDGKDSMQIKMNQDPR